MCGNNYYEPDSDAEFEVDSIKYKGVDITDLFYEITNKELELEAKCIEKLEDDNDIFED